MPRAALVLALLASTPTLAPAQVGSPAGPVPVEYLAARRADLLKRMGNGVAVIRSSEKRSIEGDYPQDSDYRENNDFFYLTGLETPSSWLVLIARDTLPPQVYLYLPARDSMAERWTGARLGPGAEATALTGIEDTRAADLAERQIRSFVRSRTLQGGTFYLLLGKEAERDTFFQQLALGTGAGVSDLRPLLDAMRLVKDSDEMRRMRMAAEISAKGHVAAMRVARPGAWEYQLEGAAEGTFRSLGAERLAYPSIVGTGINATTLHYDRSRSQLQAGELVVMDMGAEYGFYAADITRTIPVSGKFSPRQLQIYNLVLATQQAALDSIKPGITLGRLGQIAREYMKEHSGDLCAPGTCDRYFIHGLSHWLGMDVHDVGNYATPLAPNMVFTVEPGIYIPEEKLGVRIEDDVVVTATGYELLSAGAPRTAAEVEKVMGARK
ncbi:MAG TPA: aminopeptidase P N-terminal domain-containing protein [Gemmatimonadales bacterium]|nr:aminopeptidase P N-terminal domain-containing protein [Gemmatimonadales bacterium]